eukprot:scaffold16903_cov133-Isochrysis_galbana.AAC.10
MAAELLSSHTGEFCFVFDCELFRAAAIGARTRGAGSGRCARGLVSAFRATGWIYSNEKHTITAKKPTKKPEREKQPRHESVGPTVYAKNKNKKNLHTPGQGGRRTGTREAAPNRQPARMRDTATELVRQNETGERRSAPTEEGFGLSHDRRLNTTRPQGAGTPRRSRRALPRRRCYMQPCATHAPWC